MNIVSHPENLHNHSQYLGILRSIEDFLKKTGYIQIHLPLLSSKLIPESYLEVFETEFIYPTRKEKLFLTPSPELFLKRLIVHGVGSCFSLDTSFRNSEPTTNKHSHEFQMLEFYKVNAGYFDIANDTLAMMQYIAKNLYNSTVIEYQNKKIDLSQWEKITVTEAFKKFANISNVLDHESFFAEAKEKGYDVGSHSYVELWSQIYGIEVEPNLGKNGFPTVIYEYPRELAATAQYDDVRKVAERLEFYIEGIELGNCGNAGTTNTNIEEHKKRFQSDIDLRKNSGMVEHPADIEFIEVLQHLPPCAGIAIGVERLAMIFLNLKSITELQMIEIEK
jgi:elongation factor P--(R)-beta-lysine ligase